MRAQTLYASRPTGLGGNRVSRMLPGHDGTIHTLGWTLTTYATVSHELVTGTRRTRFSSSSMATTTRGFRTSSAQCWLGDDVGFGGFAFSIRFAVGANPSSMRGFFGLSAATSPVVDVDEPSLVANTMGIGFDSTNATNDPWYVIRRDGAGNVNKTPIAGASRNTDLLDLAICARPYDAGGRVVMMRLTNLALGTILLRDEIYVEGGSSYLPAADALLLVHAAVRAASTTLSLDVAQASLEVPDGARHTPVLLGRSGHYDVREFAARGDGLENDAPAFALAMSAMGPVNNFDPNEREGTLYVPPGDFAFDDRLELQRALRLVGAGPAGRRDSQGASKLTFAPLIGIRTYTHQCSPNGGDATYTIVEDLEIVGRDEEDEPDSWADGVMYAYGARVLPLVKRGVGRGWDYYYEQVRSGGPHTSAGAEPEFSLADAIDPSTGWTQGTPYRLNAAVHRTTSSGRYDRFFQCSQAGTSGTPQPTWNSTLGGNTNDPTLAPTVTWETKNSTGYFVADGGTLEMPTGPVWACKVSSGIYARCVVTLRRLGVRGFLNAGITVQANGLLEDHSVIQGSNANNFYINDVYVTDCGVGILVSGADVNASAITCAHVTPRDDGGSEKAAGINDSAFLGCRLFACRVEDCDGPAFMNTQAGSSGSAYGCSADAGSGTSTFTSSQPYGFFGNTFLAGLTTVENAPLLGAIAADDWHELRSLFTPVGEEPRYPQYYGGDSIGFFTTFVADVQGDAHRLTRSDGFAPGWFYLLNPTAETIAPIAYSTENAIGFDDRGPGYVWTPAGILVGSTRSIITVGEVKPNDGTWRRGDIVFNANPAMDAPSYWQCVDDDPLEFRDGPVLGMALNGWWRADYGGSPWEGNPSGGGSGANDLTGANEPDLGPTQNGFVPADFDPTQSDMLASAAYIEELIGLDAYTAVVLFYADTAAAAATNVEDDPALLTDTWPGWAVAFSSGGFGIAHYDGVWRRQRVACSVGEYHIGQVRYDGTDISIRVDSKDWVPLAAGNLTHTASTYVLNVGMGYLGNFFNGRILEIMLAPVAFSDARMDAIVAYLRARYALDVGLDLSGWWRADYSASPWVGTPSLGDSGSRNLTSATAPATGTAQGGYVPADFDGTNDDLASGVFIENYISESAYSIIVLFAADATEAAEPNQQDDPALVTDTMPGIAVTYSDAGFGIAHYDDGAADWKTRLVPCDEGAYHIGQVAYDGAQLKIRLDSDAWLPLGGVGNLSITPNTDTLLVGQSDAGNFFTGRVLEIMIAPTALSDATFDEIVAYMNARYALGLNLALSGWWRADYPGPTTWPGTISGGPSGVRPLADTLIAPATGTAVNGLVPAEFDGSNTLSSPVFIEEYLDPSAYSVVILFNADGVSAGAAMNIEDDPAILTDSWPGWAVTFSDGGVGVAHYDGVWKGDRVACADTGWHAAQIVYDGTELRMQVDSGGWNVLANPLGPLQHAAASYYLIAGKSYVPGYFSGRILEIMIAPEAFTEAKFDAIVDYLNARYALAL